MKVLMTMFKTTLQVFWLSTEVALQRIQLIKASESVHVAGKWATETLFSALPQRGKVLDIIKI